MDYGKILVVDFENRCDEGRVDEIISAGICVVDRNTLSITRKAEYLVRPDNKEISEYCTNITGLTWNDLKTGMPLLGLCNKFVKKYGSRNRAWFSWGSGDRTHLEIECRKKNIDFPFGNEYFNLSHMFTMFMGYRKRLSVSNALGVLNMKFEGKQHNAADDAYNTARILRYMLERISCEKLLCSNNAI